MILGLDVSTTITGATILDDAGNIQFCEAWRMGNKRHFPDLLTKAKFIKNNFKQIKKENKIKHIYIEESLWAFQRGMSSAKTLLTLAKFNGIVSFAAYEVFGTQPLYLSAQQARKKCGVPKREKGEDIKQIVLEHILDTEPKFTYTVTKHGNPQPGTYDRADSIVIAKAGYICQKNKS
jgi:Holliday junction resolvasome RuvABC endonuclease subunit